MSQPQMRQELVYGSPSRSQGRGYYAVYREAEINHCPGCGRTHWLVGRTSAECAFCATALPLEGSILDHGPAAIVQTHRPKPSTHSDVWAA
ncbi:hypothetical protein [Sphingomicrobium astaxanthinifaciens]|uniref:hypothetical protein n=1 Tax=Sphingomicrobium astaxanthinifaciens TaxID=1227949 RepID=UPI001FCC6FB9|nr:hypothetical protein [Sphingomicrobium astaxanthinifaciens]MCJ7420999.1 hypothetical protein [Sphingomicrobium astaxanthinifaciens]